MPSFTTLSVTPSSATPRTSRTPRIARLRFAAGLAACAIALSACGGGSSVPTGPAAVQPDPVAVGNLPAVDVSAVAPADTGSSLPDGWQNGAFMQIFVRSYQDSNGDGIGDLRGLTQRLDYLKTLGEIGRAHV